MRVRMVLVVAVLMLLGAPAQASGAAGPSMPEMLIAVAAITTSTTTPTTSDAPRPPRPPVTFNEFLPEQRGIGECISSVPRPGCGSDSQGGWHQTLVFIAIVAGLALIAWRIVAGARKARNQALRP